MTAIETILQTYPAAILSRGQTYATQGRVTALEKEGSTISAVVRGKETYHVSFRQAENGKTVARCTCPAWEGDRRCKHIAAVAWTVSTQPEDARAGVTSLPLPKIFRQVYSTSGLLARLSLYTRRPVRHEVERYVPLPEWWWEATHGEGSEARALAQQLVDHAPAVEEAIESLRTWQVPPSPLPRTSGFTELYVKLTKTYEEATKNVVVGSALPGPLDERHPGFTVEHDPSRRIVTISERHSPLLREPKSLGVFLPFDDPGHRIGFTENAFAKHGAADAWDLFALRELLKALHARLSPAVQRLERELDRPIWDHVLEHLVSRQGGTEEPREWRFDLVLGHRDSLLEIVAYARKVSAGAKAKWKRERFTSLLMEEVSDVEREIGRLALHAGDRGGRGGGRPEPHYVILGTPLAYDVLRLLARHPRVVLRGQFDPGGEIETSVEIAAGRLTMTLDSSPSKQLVPRFRIDGEPLDISPATLIGESWSLYRWSIRRNTIVAVEVPPPLRPWLELSSRLGDALAFPPEAIPKLASATQMLMSAGIVELPRLALGEELPYAPGPALRVEWKTDDSDVQAVIEAMIQVHASAPFVAAGSGAKLFTFEVEGKRVFVERDLAREERIADAAVDTIDVPELRWGGFVGHAEGPQEAIALASWLEANQRRWPVEVRVGHPPKILPMDRMKIGVRRIGAWLRLEASFGEDIKLTLGELLNAARLAQRYVRAGNGVFLELSQAAIAKLRPVALAAQLVPASAGEAGEHPLVHDAFGALLAQAQELFESVKGKGAVDLEEYGRRYTHRDKRIRVPSLENGALRDYQREGVAWMLQLASWAPGCVLADDMGLGKTVQTAAVLKARAKLGPALVVSPASVSSNWVSELGRFVPSLRVRWYNEERTQLTELEANDVLVVSYGLLQREVEAFCERRWATVVVDEAQYVKNIEAQRSDAVRALPRDFTIALTGTPLENHLGELFSIVDIAFPGLLGDEGTFREHFRRGIEVHRDADRLTALGVLLGPFLLRRTRASVLGELPPREEITERIELSLLERKRYLALRNECAKALEKQGAGRVPSQLRIALLSALMRLRQMACDVRLVDPEYDGPSTKIARVVELVQQLAAEGNRALVFSQFTQFLAKVRAALLDADLRVVMLTGETPTTERKSIIDGFQRGEYDVFCVSLLAGGTGLNLTKASYVIHLDPWWNPAVEEQATARAHRMGQEEPVTVYRLVARGTIEEAVLEMHAEKRELAASVLEGKASPKQLSSAELFELLRFGG